MAASSRARSPCGSDVGWSRPVRSGSKSSIVAPQLQAQAGAGALQQRLHLDPVAAELAGDLLDRAAVEVLQDEHLAVDDGQTAQRGHELLARLGCIDLAVAHRRGLSD